jgi:hypothetical protein
MTRMSAQSEPRRGPRADRLNARLTIASCVFVSAAVCAMPAHAVSIDAGDYTALPPGSNAAALYYQHAEDTSFYSEGSRVAGGDITSDIGIARYIHYMAIGGFTVDPQVLLPFGNVRGSSTFSGAGHSSGIGDAIFAATVWLVNRPESNIYFGITPFVYAPTGDYSANRELNIGEHRWKFALQAGFIAPIAPRVILDLAADGTVFLANHDYLGDTTLTQSPLFQTQAWLRYQLTSTFDLRIGASYIFGGNQSLDDISQSNRQSSPSFLVGAAWFPSRTWQMIALYGRQTSVENGAYETQRFNLRVAHFF